MKVENNISPIRQKLEQIFFGVERVESKRPNRNLLFKEQPKIVPTVPDGEKDTTAHVALRSMN